MLEKVWGEWGTREARGLGICSQRSTVSRKADTKCDNNKILDEAE